MSDIRFNRWLHQSGTGGVYQDSSGNIGIGTSTPSSALEVVGVVTATSFTGDLTGNVTGNVTGNLTGNVTGTVTGGISTTQITVGDSFIKSGAVGLGVTDTTGRNAGISTAIGTLIFNSTTNQIEAYGPEGWVNIKSVIQTGMTATGGVISEYNSGGATYRAHLFASSGTFTVNTLSADFPNTVDYLLVGGGGGSGNGPQCSGGGGAGAVVYGTGQEVEETSYTITVGAGGAGGFPSTHGNAGATSSIVFPTTINAPGGGYGAKDTYLSGGTTGGPGASGGGGAGYPGGQGGPGPATSAPNTSSAVDQVSPSPGGVGWGNPGGGTNITGGNAGGGGGGNYESGNVTVGGGAGAGGGAGNENDATIANRGSGGGGAASDKGGDGSDGVIILRVSNDYTATFTNGTTYSSSTSGSDNIYTITATSNSSQTVTFN